MPGDHAGPPPAPFVSAAPRAKVLRLALLGVAAVAALVALAGVERIAVYGKAVRLGVVAPDRWDALEARRGPEELLVVIAGLVAGVAWLMWFKRIYANIPALGDGAMRYSQRWAIVAWLIPGLNLVRPPRMTADVWRVSDPDAPAAIHYPTNPASPLITWWWALFILAPPVRALGQRLAADTSGALDTARAGVFIEVFGSLLLVISALVALRLASSLTRRQEARMSRLAPQVAAADRGASRP